MNRVVYVNDSGYGFGEIDFLQYVRFLIAEEMNKGKEWEHLLTEDYWGCNLLQPEILLKIKNYML